MSKTSLINWFGGKYKLLKYILPFPEHRVYVEPFCGSAVLLVNKIQSEAEYLNDINSRLVNMWRVIQDVDEVWKFQIKCESQGNLDSRDRFEECKIPSIDKIEDAFRFFWLGRHSYSGMYKDYGGMKVSGKSLKHLQSEWLNKLKEIPWFTERFRNVKIERQDFRHFLKRDFVDNPGVLIYLDPPYFEAGKSYGEMSGGKEWGMKEFEDLRDILWNMKYALIIISIDDPNYFTKEGWHVQRIERINSAGFVRGGKERSRRWEYIIRNFNNASFPKMKTAEVRKQESFMVF